MNCLSLWRNPWFGKVFNKSLGMCAKSLNQRMFVVESIGTQDRTGQYRSHSGPHADMIRYASLGIPWPSEVTTITIKAKLSTRSPKLPDPAADPKLATRSAGVSWMSSNATNSAENKRQNNFKGNFGKLQPQSRSQELLSRFDLVRS